jgi:2'-5' RNA ligase
MENLEELKQTTGGIYSFCDLSDETANSLFDWASTFLDKSKVLDKSEFHMSLMSSTTNFLKDHCPIRLSKCFASAQKPFRLESIKTFNSSFDTSRYALVVVVNAPEVQEFHRLLCYYGGAHKFKDFVPHITISYDVPKDFDCSNLIIPEILISPKNVYFKPLVTDFSQIEKNKREL